MRPLKEKISITVDNDVVQKIKKLAEEQFELIEALLEKDKEHIKEEIADVLCDDKWEEADVIIRCYLLGQAITEVLDDLDSDGYFDSTEE